MRARKLHSFHNHAASRDITLRTMKRGRCINPIHTGNQTFTNLLRALLLQHPTMSSESPQGRLPRSDHCDQAAHLHRRCLQLRCHLGVPQERLGRQQISHMPLHQLSQIWRRWYVKWVDSMIALGLHGIYSRLDELALPDWRCYLDGDAKDLQAASQGHGCFRTAVVLPGLRQYTRHCI
jgi:hypothetical protein